MKTEVLKQKLSRYLGGHSMPAEVNQVQTWLSIVDKSELLLSDEEKIALENELFDDIRTYAACPLLLPKSRPWWQKITALF